MRLGIVIAIILVGALAAPIGAQEETAAEEEQGTSAAADIELLEETPNYAAALWSQWNGKDVPRGFEDASRETDHFGRLRLKANQAELPLTVCIQLALQNNTDLRIQRLGPTGARAEVRRAQSIFDPAFFSDLTWERDSRQSGFALAGANVVDQRQFSINGGLRKKLLSGADATFTWINSRSKTNSEFSGLVPEYRTDLLLSLNQPLLRDFGLYFTTLLIRIAKTGQERSVYEYEATVANIVQRVDEAYWRLVQAKEDLAAVEQGLAAARELQRQNEGKYKVGSLPRTAVLEAEAEVARREADLILARNAITEARDNLRALVNYEPEGSGALLLIEPADQPTVLAYEIDLERSLENAKRSRPELRAAALAVEERAMQLKIAENQLLPRLNANGQLGTSGLAGDPQPNPLTGELNPFDGSYGDALRRMDGEFYNYAAGVTLEIPIGNGLAKADYARSRVDLEAARRSLRKTQEDITLEIKTTTTRLESALKSIEARRIARELAEENLRNQQARYDVGLSTTKDILDFQDRLTQARAFEIAALTAYNIQLTALQRADGTLLAARNIVVERGDAEKRPWWALF